MEETAPGDRRWLAASATVLGAGLALLLVELPGFLAGQTRLSPLLYLPPLAAAALGHWKRQPLVLAISAFWFLLFLACDLYFRISLFPARPRILPP